MTFKYIRSMEAVFESMPQAVLQLVYVMRTTKWGTIFIISIIQSVISMTNSVLKDDNSRGMHGSKWKKHKKRFPPTFEFFKHAISRLSQIISRICILSLFWTVVGGLTFLIIIVIEFVIAVTLAILNSFDDGFDLNGLFLFLTSIIIIPPEIIYGSEFGGIEWHKYVWPMSALNCTDIDVGYLEKIARFIMFGCMGWVCGGAFSTILSSILSCGQPCKHNNGEMYTWPTIRLGISFNELMLIVIFGVLNKNDNYNNYNYLFEFDHGFGIFILCIISYLIDCCYLKLFPNFSLPHNINPRSKYGYAFGGELTELEKINPILTKDNYFVQQFSTQLQIQVNQVNEIEMKQLFWDEPYLVKDSGYGTISIDGFKFSPKGTCAYYAIANKRFDIVEWLESQGAKNHINYSGYRITPQDARKIIDKTYDGWV